eukprot:scaffold21856_cov174-Isochrysis_galbana.AAC.2
MFTPLSQSGAQQSAYLIETSSRKGGVMCKDLACACAPLGAQAVVVLCWCSGHAEAADVALWFTMLPFTGLRGCLGDSGMAMLIVVVVGAQAEGAARASAGSSSMLT